LLDGLAAMCPDDQFLERFETLVDWELVRQQLLHLRPDPADAKDLSGVATGGR
jgi:hypothetical protein